MSCGCNKKSAISIGSQLPPGCDSILNIDTNALETETIVTITFCSGAQQQFSIPHGTNGIDGTIGGDGSDGTNGDSVEDVEVTQEGSTVYLTFTIGGEEYTINFELPTSGNGAYIVEHKSQGIGVSPADFTQVILNDATSDTEFIKGTIPGSTIVNAGDTLHWDAVFMFKAGSTKDVVALFKVIYLCLGSEDNLYDDRQVHLTGDPDAIVFPLHSHVQISVELSKTNSSSRDEMYLKGTMTVADFGDGEASIFQSDSMTDLQIPLAQQTYSFYKLVSPLDFTIENFIQLRGIRSSDDLDFWTTIQLL